MANVFRASAMVLVLVPLASGCSSVPRWDWWRSAQTGPPPEAMMAKNEAPKYPDLPSATTTPTNLTASNGSATTPPGTSAPATDYPNTDTATASTVAPTSYPTTAATGAVPPTAGTQTGPYDANAYNPYAAGAAQPVAHVASNPNQYGTSVPQYNPNAGAVPAAGGYPTTNPPAAYPSTDAGYNTPASYGPPAAGAAPYGAAPGAADPNGYGTGSRYDAPAGDRYGAGAAAPAAQNYGAPAANAYPPAANTYPAATNNYPPANNSYPPANNNYGAPANSYPPTGADGGYRGSDATAPSSVPNYAATPGAANDRYGNPDPTAASAGPVATTADLRSSSAPASVPRYDSAVTPASGGSYLPAGTKRLEGEMPSAPVSAPAGGASATPPYGYQTPGSMG